MPNRSCDFCRNSYRVSPRVGYYKVSENIRIKLNCNRKNLEDSHYDFNSGDHFYESCFDENGRLRQDAIPTITVITKKKLPLTLMGILALGLRTLDPPLGGILIIL